MSAARLHVRVSGRVQGVGFRYSAERQAHCLGLTGWVRNLPDGDVEAVAEAEETSLRRFLDWCGHGPPSARVTRVESSWSAATGEFRDFRTR
jgi:acylphosphatase